MSGPAWTWRHAILEAELPATTKHVLLTISCFMNDVGEGCYRWSKRARSLHAYRKRRQARLAQKISARLSGPEMEAE